ncbi:hypothetical protein [Helicobacter zhangjianzhongii]|uniref:Uncharacterized protein n=1 Tax=Helicobacter zhangjianzhongii TaxID=2974574 RepID=A0ACC6FSH9_9HELI|nr:MULTISPECIES: hypothetical protein [unclassified Helicobacter]MDL0080074.1 hypothetical protein [Helicobacter sp. CPD2-1]MDL0081863.1 hypothetical protein [Helicobacter sp. XJK30-2]
MAFQGLQGDKTCGLSTQRDAEIRDSSPQAESFEKVDSSDNALFLSLRAD